MAATRDASRTRERIAAVARQHFALHGYDGATVRAVAAEAEVAPNLITRYFGGKRGLFDAATEIRLQVEDVLAGDVDGLGGRLAAHVVARWESRPGDDPLMTLLRAAMTDPVAARRTAQLFHVQATAPLAARLGDERAWERAAAVSAVLKGTLVDRYVLHTPTLGEVDAAAVVPWLAGILQHLLTGPAPASLRPTRPVAQSVPAGTTRGVAR